MNNVIMDFGQILSHITQKKKIKLIRPTYLCVGLHVSLHITRKKVQPSFLSSFRTRIQVFSCEISAAKGRIGKQANVAIIWMANFNEINYKSIPNTSYKDD